METKVSVSTTYNCSLERAFKTPILCDVSKVHTGYGLMPKVTHSTDDHDWEKLEQQKSFAAKSLTQKVVSLLWTKCLNELKINIGNLK